jgi:hypothetical protein
MGTICGTPTIGYMRREVIRLSGNLVIANGHFEEAKRRLSAARANRTDAARQLREAEAWIASARKKAKK